MIVVKHVVPVATMNVLPMGVPMGALTAQDWAALCEGPLELAVRTLVMQGAPATWRAVRRGKMGDSDGEAFLVNRGESYG